MLTFASDLKIKVSTIITVQFKTFNSFAARKILWQNFEYQESHELAGLGIISTIIV